MSTNVSKSFKIVKIVQKCSKICLNLLKSINCVRLQLKMLSNSKKLQKFSKNALNITYRTYGTFSVNSFFTADKYDFFPHIHFLRVYFLFLAVIFMGGSFSPIWFVHRSILNNKTDLKEIFPFDGNNERHFYAFEYKIYS